MVCTYFYWFWADFSSNATDSRCTLDGCNFFHRHRSIPKVYVFEKYSLRSLQKWALFRKIITLSETVEAQRQTDSEILDLHHPTLRKKSDLDLGVFIFSFFDFRESWGFFLFLCKFSGKSRGGVLFFCKFVNFDLGFTS